MPEIPLYKTHWNIKKVAQKPPLGWNSWIVYGTSIAEDEVKMMADAMSEKLKQHGYEYIVIDMAWYAVNTNALPRKNYEPPQMYKDPYPEQIVDKYGRLFPDPSRFPSSGNGKGFKPLADYVHSKGLKFGIHVLRGLPRQAVERNTPVKDTKFTAQDIVCYEKTCVFYDGMLGIDMALGGAQEYYNSITELYAQWGVDFIKADDMTSWPTKLEEIQGLRYAMDHCGRDMVLSLSPGGPGYAYRSFMQRYTDMYRISGDFWDNWQQLKEQFQNCRPLKGHIGPGCWGDCDMIPLGIVNLRAEGEGGEHPTRFTKEEQYMLMTLWAIYRSPLILSFDLTRIDDFTYALITNKDMLVVNQQSVRNDEIYYDAVTSIWTAESGDGSAKYLALFNLDDSPRKLKVSGNQLSLSTIKTAYDIWAAKETQFTDNTISAVVDGHGCRFFKIARG